MLRGLCGRQLMQGELQGKLQAQVTSSSSAQLCTGWLQCLLQYAQSSQMVSRVTHCRQGSSIRLCCLDGQGSLACRGRSGSTRRQRHQRTAPCTMPLVGSCAPRGMSLPSHMWRVGLAFTLTWAWMARPSSAAKARAKMGERRMHASSVATASFPACSSRRVSQVWAAQAAAETRAPTMPGSSQCPAGLGVGCVPELLELQRLHAAGNPSAELAAARAAADPASQYKGQGL